MRIKVTNHEKNTSEVIDTFMTVRQYAIINSCGVFNVVKVGKDYNLLDPFTGVVCYTFSKA